MGTKQIILSDEEYQRLARQDGMILAAQNYIDTATYPELDVLAAIIGLDLEIYYQNKREGDKTCTSVFLKM